MRLRYGPESQGEVIGRFQLAATGGPQPAAVVALDGGLRPALERPPAERTRLQRDQLAQAYPPRGPRAGRRAGAAGGAEASARRWAWCGAGAGAGGEGRPPSTPLRRGGSFLRRGNT